MKVLMVLDKEFPPDERVEKEIKTLQESGFNVAIAVYTQKGQQPSEVFNGYRIFRRKISVLLFKSSAAALLHPFYFRFWYRYLSSILKHEQFDIIHIHDLPLTKVGYKLAKKYNMKLVCDQHEYYSNWIVRTKHMNTLIGRITKKFSDWKKYERVYLQRADLVITVEDALREIYIEQVGILKEKIITVPNTPSEKTFNIHEVNPEIIERYAGRFVLFYAGGLDHLRGIDFIMKALALLKNEIKDILFVIAGKENSAFNLDAMISENGIQDATDFVGWIDLPQLSSYTAAANICLFVPRADNLEINNTIVTKIYQYAAMGKPIIVSEARKMKEFVESNRIGFAVPYGDLKSLCQAIRTIHDDPSIAEAIKSRSVEIARQNTWEKTSQSLVNSYLKLYA